MDPRSTPELGWHTLPMELLCMMFKMFDIRTLTRCMFVCVTWNKAALYVVELKGLWEEIVAKFMIDKGASTMLKSSIKFGWKDVFVNHLLWNSLSKADMVVKRIFSVKLIKNIHVYKRYLIVVHSGGATYFDIDRGYIQRHIHMKCQDFQESDDVILKLTKCSSTHKTLYLYGKNDINDFNIETSANEMRIDKVMHYRLVKDCCYVLDTRNSLTQYKLSREWGRCENWAMKHMGRFYGSDSVTVDLNVFKDDVFVMLKWGVVLYANGQCGFEKAMDVQVPETEPQLTVFIRMFHSLCIVFGVRSTDPFSYQRCEMNRDRAFLLECPDLTCVTEHGDLLFVGYNNGAVRVYMPRINPEENVLRYEKVFFDVPELKNEVIVAIDVFEEKGRNHIFVATHQRIAHIIYDHKNMEEYMWNDYPEKASLTADGNSF